MDIGAKIRRLRQANGLTLEELASRSELTKGFLSQVERNLTSPSISTLEDILEALGTTLPAFFAEETEPEQVIFSKPDWFVDQQEGKTIHWVIPNAQKNDMEPILLELQPGATFDMDAHSGQEFGMVLEGQASLVRSQNSLPMHAGDTFYLDGSLPHTLLNAGDVPCRLLWIVAPPAF